MTLIEAAAWGVVGGIVAGMVTMSTAIVAVGFRWPWHDNEDGIWPRLFVFAVGVIVGGGVAAAAHSEMTSAWPAFIMGVGAPTLIRGALSHLEVTESKSTQAPHTGEDHAPG